MRATYLVLTLLVVITACDSQGSSEEAGNSLNPCTFVGRVSGSLETGSLTGAAVMGGELFGDSNNNSNAFIALRPGPPSYGLEEIYLRNSYSRSVAVGQYDIEEYRGSSNVSVDWSGFLFGVDQERTETVDGTLNLSIVEENQLVGDIIMVVEDSTGQRSVVTAEFNASRPVGGEVLCESVGP